MKPMRLLRSWIAVLAAAALAGCGAPSAPSTASPAELEALREALSSALAIPDPFQRVHQLATVLADVKPGSAPELKHALDLVGNRGMGVAEYDLLARAWAAEQPEDAARTIGTIASGSRLRISAFQIAAEAWARKDPADAVANLTIAAQSGIREFAQAAQQGIVRGWYQVDRPGVEKYIEDLTGIEQQRAMLAYALSLQGDQGSDALIRWAQAIPDDKERYRRAVYREVTMALAWADRRASERWCEMECEGPYGKALRTTIVRVRLQNGEDGADVLKWVGNTKESESQLHALRVGYQLWALKDEDPALAWMKERIAAGRDPWVEKLYGAYARQLSVRSPAEAIPWAEKIPAEKTRTEMLVRIARRWMRRDPAAAEAWLATSSLSEEKRASARDLSKPDYLPREYSQPADDET